MIIVSLITASPFLVGCGLCRWRIRQRWLRLPTVGGNIAGSPDAGPGCREIVQAGQADEGMTAEQPEREKSAEQPERETTVRVLS